MINGGAVTSWNGRPVGKTGIPLTSGTGVLGLGGLRLAVTVA